MKAQNGDRDIALFFL